MYFTLNALGLSHKAMDLAVKLIKS
jgi:hypothetical protein